MSFHDRLRSSGWFILLPFVGASILSSCGTEPPDFSSGTGGDSGVGGTGGIPADGDTGGTTGVGDTGGASADGDGGGNGDTGGTSGDGDGDGDTGGTFGDGDGDEGTGGIDGSDNSGGANHSGGVTNTSGGGGTSGDDGAGGADSCGDLMTDDLNCGSCGHACPGTSSCVSGSCECTGDGELLCSTSCIDAKNDVSNCGSCGHACTTPSQPGSSAVCDGGECGSCGAYSQDCCGTSCGSGFVCASGSCECQVGSHYCSSGHATGSCADDDDISNCGPTCADCNQPNAQAACVNDACANTCPAGIATLCPAGSNGKPSCGNWNFESNDVEGWAFDASGSGASFAPGGDSVLVGNESRYGNYSLAIPFDSTIADRRRVIVRAPLCSSGQAVDLTGKTITAYVRFVTAAGSPALADSQGSNAIYLYSGPNNPRGGGSGFQVNKTTGGDSSAGSWFRAGLDVDVGFTLAPEIPPAATHVGLMFGPYPWKGTIYVDRVEIQ